MQHAGLALRAAFTIVLALPLPGLVSAVRIDTGREWQEAPSSSREFEYTRRHLRQSFDGYGTKDVFVGEFAVVALSHFAAGLMNVHVAEPARDEEVISLLDEVVRRAKNPLVAPSELANARPIDASVKLDDHNLYFSHLAVILGVRRLVACSDRRDTAACMADPDDALLSRIVAHLRARSLASPLHHAPSYPGSEMWPADQAVTLLAFRIYDETHGTHLLDAPLEGFLSTMKKHTDPSTGLFHSSVSPELDYATTPRGCATSWTTLYLAQVAPDVARAQYARYREHMRDDVLGFGGFREWPGDRARGADVDSGPIIFGVGMAATALALGPTRLFGDAERYATIRRSALTFGLPSWIPSHGHLTAPVLGEAILFHGRTARPWFAASSEKAGSTSTGGASFSTASAVLLVAYVALIVAWIRSLAKRARNVLARTVRD